MPELRFRDGKRVVPDYISSLMSGLETRKMTYDEAIAAMNRQMLTNHTDRVMGRMLADHFAGKRRD